MGSESAIHWDPAKNEANIAKHGLPLAFVADVIAGEVATYRDTRRDYGEDRFVTFGYVQGSLPVAVWTQREEGVRAISVRKANSREVRRYDQ